ncbi:TetR family transcriptional regulator [Gluconobacter japonicus]|nr:TetR family transcriptional regulator [Gluconobacter japonicus]
MPRDKRKIFLTDVRSNCQKIGMKIADKQDAARRHIVEAARPLIGARGFSNVGISQILEVAQIPKGSFYHYFESKEAFGEELLRQYVSDYLANMDHLFMEPEGSGAERLFAYCRFWWDTHVDGKVGDKCLIVKLGAEISDLSEPMRQVLEAGTEAAIERITILMLRGQKDGSIRSNAEARTLAAAVYQGWLGATLMVKITRSSHPFDTAWVATQRVLDHT